MKDVGEFDDACDARRSQGVGHVLASVCGLATDVFDERAGKEEVIVKPCCSGNIYHLLYYGTTSSDVENLRHGRDLSVQNAIWCVGYLNRAKAQNWSRVMFPSR